MSKRVVADLCLATLLILLYVAAGKLGLSLAFVNASASGVWPPTAIALAAMLVMGYRFWPVILLGAFLVNVTTSGSVVASLTIAAGNTLEGLLGAWLVDRYAHGRRAFDSTGDIFRFVVLAGTAATAVSATVGVTSLAVNDLARWNDYGEIWFTWWLGDTTGALIATPALVLWANALHDRRPPRRVVETLLAFLLLAIVTLAVFGSLTPFGVEHYPIAYIVLPIVVWFALRLGAGATASAMLLLCGIAIAGTLQGFGPFARYPDNQALLLLQGFTAVLSVTGISLAAAAATRQKAEEALRASEEQYRIVTETANDAILTIDRESTIVFASAAVEKIFGYRAADVTGRPLTMLMPEPLRERHRRALARYCGTGARSMPWANVEVTGLHKDGHEIPLELSFGEFKRHDRHLFIGVVRDITERQRAGESLRWLATIVESSSDAVIGKSLDGTVLSWNRAAETIYGYSATEMIGRSVSVLAPPDRSEEIPQLLARVRGGEHVQNFVTERVRKDGGRIAVALTISPIADAAGAIYGASTIARDITEHKRAEERIRYLAQHDALTGLPNRILLHDRISQAITYARRTQQHVAVLFIDLDDFKSINDSLGHQAGDHLLRRVARRLELCLREGDSVARLGGDEFVVNLTGLTKNKDAMTIAEKILHALHEPFSVAEHELHISGSIGISVFPSDGQDVGALMRAADTAMYYAKQKGRDNFQFFTPRLNDAAQRRLAITNRLHQALQRGEFLLEYQPQVRLADGAFVAAEALLRWRHPELGLVLPGDFIAIAEEAGLIAPIGEWVLREACTQLRRWHQAGHPAMRMAVNISPQQFRRPDFTRTVADILRDAGVPATALEMEITENVLIANTRENIAALEQLADIGITLAVDDFGTGYSGLAYLHRFPVHTLKIDRSFIDGIGENQNDMTIVNAIIAMAHSLHLNVIAEGVETTEQFAFLKMHGCLAAQGFFYSQPLPSSGFDRLLGTHVMVGTDD